MGFLNRTVSQRVMPAAALVVTLILTACGGGGGGSSSSPGEKIITAITCSEVNGIKIPASQIGLPTTGAVVTSSSIVAASGSGSTAIGEYCLVSGQIAPATAGAPNIDFQLALPTHWNNKFMMLGGGGFDGTIPNVAGNVPNGPTTAQVPVGRGYAVAASDSGHQANALGALDGSFSTNTEAYANFMGEALKKVHDVALYIVKKRYAVNGVSEAYFAGGSTGGREALTVAQRWPEDWSGVIAYYPAYDFTTLSLQQLRVTEGFAGTDAYLDTAKRALLYNAVMATCDSLDGVTDGLISNVAGCNTAFNPSTAVYNGVALRCPGGADTGDTCLSDAQITALNTMNTPLVFTYALASGETQYPGYNVWGADLGQGNTTPLEATVTELALGTVQPAYPLLSTMMFDGQIADQFVRYTVTNNVNLNSLTFDPASAGTYETQISNLSALDADSTNLLAFNAKGGKLLMLHGTVDMTVSTRATENYYNGLVSTMGQDTVNNFVRFYEIPGLQHAVSSTFNATYDSLSALENWVQLSVAPVNQVVTDTSGVPGRTRPLCQYPTWPQYNGSGNVNVASSFTCVP